MLVNNNVSNKKTSESSICLRIQSYYSNVKKNIVSITRGVLIWLFTDIPITDMQKFIKPIKYNWSDII